MPSDASDTSVTPADKPLEGLCVVVTRTREQSDALVQPLEALGAEVLSFPVIEVVDPEDPGPLDEAIHHLSDYDWLILTSTNGVDRFFARVANLRAPGADLAELLSGVRVAAVGSATAGHLRHHGVEPDLVPVNYRAEGLVEALRETGLGAGSRVLIPRAAEAREVLPEQLASMGARVDAVDVYHLAPVKPDPAVLTRLNEGSIDVVTFASGATARHFVDIVKDAGLDPSAVFSVSKIASVGPVTSAGIHELGFEVDIEAPTSTMQSLVEEIAGHFGGEFPGSRR